jgi:CheY-like chemotaxis protein
VKLATEAFSLNTLICSTVSIIEGAAEAKGLALHVRTDPDMSLHNHGDPARLRQILLNLLSNAVKFTSTGSITLDARMIGYDGAGEHLRFTITDTGPGVHVDGRPMLFQQFTQADASTSREHGGTGLGLSICKSLVDLMGGRIGFTEVPSGGSSFWFEVVLQRAPKQELKRETEHYHRGETAHLKILLVEDVAMNQELACAVLRRAGHVVDVANDGIEAVAAVQEQLYDVILMDIQMPRMDGVTATRRIRELSGPARHTPIIALTANAMPEQVFEYHRAGMIDHVAKPFKQRELHDAINRAVNPLAKWHRAIDGWTNGRGAEVRVSEQEHVAAPPAPEEKVEAPPCEGIFDADALAKVEALITPERVHAYLRELDGQMAMIAGSAMDEAALQSQAHKIISQAGMMGLLRVSQCARSLVDAYRSGEGQAEALVRFQATAGDIGLYAAPASGLTLHR